MVTGLMVPITTITNSNNKNDNLQTKNSAYLATVPKDNSFLVKIHKQRECNCQFYAILSKSSHLKLIRIKCRL